MLRRLGDQPTSYRRLLARPRYRSFVLTVAFSRVSGSMFNTAGILLVLDRTGSPALAGVTAAAAVLPGALSGPVLGAWLDVVHRRRVLMVIDQAAGIVGLLGMVLLAGHAPNWTVPAVAVIYGFTRPFSLGGFYNAMAAIAGSELLDEASTIDATILNAAVILGPSLAAALTGIVGPAPTVEVQAVLTLVAIGLIAVNPAFDARVATQDAAGIRAAVRVGMRAIGRAGELRVVTGSSILANFGWGLMLVTFPLYCGRVLDAAPHDSGFLWAALGAGSILGTFGLAGAPSLRRIGASYLVLGLSALAWPAVHSLALGIALIGLTGFIEGPAFSGTVALRQRHAPPAVRAQVVTTIVGMSQVAASVGSAAGGAIHDPGPAIGLLAVVNLFAGGLCRRAAMRHSPA